jgi:hypothetical protein
LINLHILQSISQFTAFCAYQTRFLFKKVSFDKTSCD